MRQPEEGDQELPAMNNTLNSVLNHHQLPSLHHDHAQTHMLPSSNFDPASSHDEFLEQMLSSVPSSFPWSDDQPSLDDHSAAALASKMRQQQISNGAAKALMLQHENDASIKALFNGFTEGSFGQTSNHSQHFHHPQGGGLQQPQTFGTAAAPAISQPAASGSNGGGAAVGQPRQRVRARRGQATDPHSIAERLRRERIAERMKALQELVPNANKTDKASMLDEIIDYVKFLQLQVKVLSMSRLGGAAAVAPIVADKSHEGKSGNGVQMASSSNNNDGMTVAEHQVAKLMEDDMGSAMQYLQGKGLCLMPISLATAISTATSHSRNPLATPFNNPLINADAGGPTSPSISTLTVQSATMGGGGEVTVKDAAAASKME